MIDMCRVDIGGNKERDVGGNDETLPETDEQTMTLFGRVAMIGHFHMNCIEQIKWSDLTVSFETQRKLVAHFNPLHNFGVLTRIMEFLRLKKRRHSHKIVIQRQLEKLEDSMNDVSHFKMIRATLVGKLKSLEDINEEILSSIDEEEMENERVETEDYLLEIRLCIRDLESKYRATVEAIHSSSLNLEHPVTGHSSSETYGNRNNSTSGNEVSNTSLQSTSTSQFHKLPKLTLPTLSGVILEWQTFWDCYESSIHNNISLSEVQKFFYMKSLLTDEAASVIEGLPITHGSH